MTGDDLPMATVLISEAILRLRVDPPISHEDLKRSLTEVLAENRTQLRLVPVIADATASPQRGVGTIADATQPLIRRGAA